MKTLNEFFELAMKRDMMRDFIKTSSYHWKQINLGPGNNPIRGATNIGLPEWDAERDPLPFDDESVHIIHAYHFLEHIENIEKILLECQRVLMTGGVMNICVPWYRSQIAYQDLDHKHFFTENTWRMLFDNQYYDRGFKWKFEVTMNCIIGLEERNMVMLTQLVKI